MSKKEENAFHKLKSDIMGHAGLSSMASTGFYEVYCPVCRDQRKKTGGFKLDHDKIIYNCFRASCDATTVYTLGEPVSRKFKRLMEAIAVTIPIELRMKKSKVRQALEDSLDEDLYHKHSYKPMRIPTGFTPMRKLSKWTKYFIDRKISPDGLFAILEGQYKGCAAVPLYFYNKLIGFQIVTDGKVKYITHTDGNDNLLAINKGKISDQPIVVEGVLDAMCFPNAVGIMKSRISPEQAYHLLGKDVILMPDRRSGEDFLRTMKDYGWKMFIPPWKDVKDLNDCVVKYGKLSTAMMITSHTYDNPKKAEVAYGLWSLNTNKWR